MSKGPAWSLRTSQSEMIVAVSPARQTLQIAGSSGVLIGAGISAIANAKHRKAVMEALQGYDAGLVFEKRLHTRIREVMGANIERVAPLGSTAGYSSVRDAESARYAALARNGTDLLLDLKMTYGLFGYEGTLVAKLEGGLLDIPAGRAVWRNALVVSSEPILASNKLSDPTKRLGANLSSPRLTIEQDAISQWTQDGGAVMRQRFEAAVGGVVSALLVDLGLVKEAEGAYYLGKQALNQKKFDKAEQHFRDALALDPGYTDAKNGLSVKQAHSKDLDQAIASAQAIVASSPEYGPAYFNLAWWHAVEKNDLRAAKPYYNRALLLGMPAEKKIDKLLAKNSS